MDAGFVLWPVAFSMAAIVAALVRWAASVRSLVGAAVVVFLLGMMGAMLAAVAIYFSSPSVDALVVGIWVAAALMAVSVFPVFALFLREARRAATDGPAYRPAEIRTPVEFALVVTGVVLGSELLMGRGFALADGSVARTLAPVPLFTSTVASPFFLFPMAAEMALSLLWLGRRVPIVPRVLLASLVAMMASAPPAFPSAGWAIGGSVVTAVSMSIALAVVLRSAYRGEEPSRAVRLFVVGYLAAGGLATAGIALWATGGSLAVFAIGMVAQMIVFFTTIVAPETLGSSPSNSLVPPESAPTATVVETDPI